MRSALLTCVAALALAAPAAAQNEPGLAAPHSCIRPAAAKWRHMPNRCYVVTPRGDLRVPRAATEMDIWSPGGKIHLRQRLTNRIRGCPQFGFAAHGGYSAGWDTCNRDLYNFGRHTLMVAVWFS